MSSCSLQRYLLSLLCLAAAFPLAAQSAQPLPDMPLFSIPFETNPNQTLLYDELIDCYEKLSLAYPEQFRLLEAGDTDSGMPLHLAVLSADGVFDPEKIRQSGRLVLFINNGIHPGEPEGIDATVMLLRDILADPDRQDILKYLVIVAIPVYNVDGCLNRNSTTRANQNGPESYGFRGNDRNYDLNRDFIKCDTRNARSFNRVFRTWDPDVFIDNHTSNGADYPYTMTLIPTQHNKLEAPLGDFLQQSMLPALYTDLRRRGWDMTPYVDGPGDTPDSGLTGFLDHGRYSTGYAALWNTIGFMPETHMLKPFADRLKSTYAFMESVIAFLHAYHAELGKAREQAKHRTRTKTSFALDWQLDTTRRDEFRFKGYAAKYKPSEVSGLPRLYYDRNEPWEKNIPYYNHYVAAKTADKPWAYIIPQAWTEVLERLRINGAEMQQLTADVTLEVEDRYVRNFKTRNAWEGHYYHYAVECETRQQRRQFRAGDYVVRTDQDANRYLLETLEPQAPDSWFAWNFFESILMQKEYFSAYVFEDLAAEFLRENPAVKAELEKAVKEDADLAASASKQLDWVYRHSPWYEPTHRLYPVARLATKQDLPLD